MTTKWLTAAEATKRYGLSRTTLYRLIWQGKVARATRAGDRRIYVSADDLKHATALRPIPPTPRRKRK
ncbi:MAG: helix-turn-helix transcriptional regulator [Actinomycetota bacterium]